MNREPSAPGKLVRRIAAVGWVVVAGFVAFAVLWGDSNVALSSAQYVLMVVVYFFVAGLVVGLLWPDAFWLAVLASWFPSIMVVTGIPQGLDELWWRYFVGTTLVPASLAVVGALVGRRAVAMWPVADRSRPDRRPSK